ncbi:MAG: SpoIID/LytB domain-containing protein [Eubacteriales bacterium]
MTTNKRLLTPVLILCILLMSALPALILSLRPKNGEQTDTIRLYRQESGQIEELAFADYLEGCLAADLDFETDYPEQALLAFSIATESKLLSLCGRCEHAQELAVDFCDDPDHGSGYLPKSEAVECYGETVCEPLYSKIHEAVSTVLGFGVCYEGELALTLMHDRSYLLTEDAKNVGHTDIPYLCSVRTYEEIECYEVTLSEEVVSALLLSNFGIKDGIPEILSRTAAGRVDKVQIGDQVVEGWVFASALFLPSTDFTIEKSVSTYRFTIRGEGNGVGMSRSGAIKMAEEGAEFEDIIAAYYPGTAVLPIDIPALLEQGRK